MVPTYRSSRLHFEPAFSGRCNMVWPSQRQTRLVRELYTCCAHHIESDRFKGFAYDDLLKRDKVNLDIFWLRDESLEDSANLPDPHVLALEIAEELEGALEQFAAIAEALKRRRPIPFLHLQVSPFEDANQRSIPVASGGRRCSHRPLSGGELASRRDRGT
jgi:hypothetical protein